MCKGVFFIAFSPEISVKQRKGANSGPLDGLTRTKDKAWETTAHVVFWSHRALSCILEKVQANHHVYIKTVPYQNHCICKMNFKSTLFSNFLLSETSCLNCLATLTASKELRVSCQIMKCSKNQLGDETVERTKSKELRTVWRKELSFPAGIIQTQLAKLLGLVRAESCIFCHPALNFLIFFAAKWVTQQMCDSVCAHVWSLKE